MNDRAYWGQVKADVDRARGREELALAKVTGMKPLRLKPDVLKSLRMRLRQRRSK